jgi:hypothetical protein
MRTYRDWAPAVALMLAVPFASSAHADVMGRRIVGPLRVELQLQAAEPLLSKEDATAKNITKGMEIVGGQAPVMPDAASGPNHLLVLRVFNRQTGQVVTDATVTMRIGPIGEKGHPAGAQVEIPVVVMQAIGKGPSSTLYGNNVALPASQYQVYATVNGDAAVFRRVNTSGTP